MLAEYVRFSMPTYAWKCNDCNLQFDGFIKVRDLPYVTECIMCGSANIKRLIEPAKVHFKHTDPEVRIPSPPKSVYIRRKE